MQVEVPNLFMSSFARQERMVMFVAEVGCTEAFKSIKLSA